MNPIETVTHCLKAVETGKIDEYERMLASTWTMSVNGARAPMDRVGYLTMLTALRRAIPDMEIRPEDISVDGEWVRLTTSIVGNHTEPFEVPGAPAIPASRRRIEQPRQKARFLVRGGLIVEEQIETPEGVDPASVYRQMGVNLPD